jgi:hypothetical protein
MCIPQQETASAVPGRLLASLERSKTQAGAGETVPAGPILDELRTSIARMKANMMRLGHILF